jgi:hypothetical protein
LPTRRGNAKLNGMRLALLVAAFLTLGVVWSAPAPFEAELPQAQAAAAADACPEQDEEGDAEEAQHVTKSGDPAGSGDEEGSGGGEDEESDEDAPPKFSNAFHRRWFSMDASTDGFDAPELPVSIEAVCDLPARLQKEADPLNGTDGVAVVSSRTRIVKDGKLLGGTTGTAELEGADTAFLKVRLFRPAKWREDEDGNKIPTFRARRIAITD